MSSFKMAARQILEQHFGMASGYVLSFSDRTFGEFVFEAVGRKIHDAKYTAGGTSKANKLRTFWKVESDSMVGKQGTMSTAYIEDQLVEQPAIGLFVELGWTTASALEETFGAPSPGLAATLSHPMGEGASLGRETKGEVVEEVNKRVPPLQGGVGLVGPSSQGVALGWRVVAPLARRATTPNVTPNITPDTTPNATPDTTANATANTIPNATANTIPNTIPNIIPNTTPNTTPTGCNSSAQGNALGTRPPKH